jgi:DNA-binding LytR/AlgR family response regulator
VNLDHVSRMRQSASGRVELVMSTGTIVPVPRARAGELRAALANRD